MDMKNKERLAPYKVSGKQLVLRKYFLWSKLTIRRDVVRASSFNQQTKTHWLSAPIWKPRDTGSLNTC